MYIKERVLKMQVNGVFRFEKFQKMISYHPISVLEMIKKSLTTGGSLGGLNPPMGNEGGVNVFYIYGREI